VDSSKQKRKGQEGYDPLFKIRPVVDHLNAVSKGLYNPRQELSVDEMTMGTGAASLSSTIYIPTKFGLKVWVNAEATTGYVLSFSVYTGAANSPSSGLPLAHRVVLELLEEYLGKGYKVYMENFHTSVPLLKELLEKGTWACGTIQKNRKHFSEQLRDTKLKPGEVQLAPEGQLLQLTGLTDGMFLS